MKLSDHKRKNADVIKVIPHKAPRIPIHPLNHTRNFLYAIKAFNLKVKSSAN